MTLLGIHTERRRASWLLKGMVVLLAFLIAGCQGEGGPTEPDDGPVGSTATQETASDSRPELTPVRYGIAGATEGLVATTNAQMSSVPIEMGYWEQEGVEVEVIGFTGGADMMQALIAGRIDMGNAGSTPFYQFAAEGAPIMSVCQHLPHFISTPFVPDDSDRGSVSDLAGATIAVNSLEVAQIPFILALLDAAGVDQDTVEFVPIPVGSTAAAAFESGLFDVFGYFDTQHAQMRTLLPDANLRPLELPESFEGLGFAGGIFTTRDYLDVNRDAVEGVLKGFARAAEFSTVDSATVVKIHQEHYPETRRTGVPDDEALALDVEVFESRLPNMEPVEGLWCNTPTEDIEALMRLLLETGQIDEPIDVEAHSTNEFVELVNDFDHEAVRAEAAAWEEG